MCFFFVLLQADLLGQNILKMIHPDDHAEVKKQFIPSDMSIFDSQTDDGVPRHWTDEEEDEIDRKLMADKRRFHVR